MKFLEDRKRFLIAISLIVFVPLVLALLINFLNKGSSEKQAGPTEEKVIYKCPSTVEFCQSGADLESSGVYLGFGAEIPEGSPIYAAFDGKLSISTTILTQYKDEKVNTLYLENDGHMAIYYFVGDTSPEREVKTGDLIGRSLKPIEAYDTSLIFLILKGDPIKGEKVRLSTANFVN